MTKTTQIPIKENTRDQLKKICEFEGRTYDSLINELLDLYLLRAKRYSELER